jgi:hypothetical protein
VLANAIINWRIATEYERNASGKHDLEAAYVLRSSYVDLVTLSALLLGGAAHAATIGADVRRWAHQEGYELYLENLVAEKAAREGT